MRFVRLFLGVLAVTAGAHATAQGASPDATRDMAAACAICHGTNGQAPGGMPILAGQSKDTLARSMRDFRDARRPATIMHQITKGYSDPQIDALAAYFAAQPSLAGK